MLRIFSNKRLAVTENQFGILLLLPGFLIFSFIILYPFVNSIIMSFTDQTIFSTKVSFIGLGNYIRVLSDPYFPSILKNTMFFVVVGNILPFILGFIWALVLNQKFKGSEFIRGLTLVNWIIPSTSVGFLWMWIFHGQFGILNAALKGIGIIEDDITWLGRADTAMWGVIIAKSWRILPWFMTFLLAGLQGVSKEIVESSIIDGCGNLRVLWHIILPEMKSVIVFILILSGIASLQNFDLIWVMTEGGPARATTTMSIEVYKRAFMSFKTGLAASVGTAWVILMAVFGIFYLRRVKGEV